MKALRDFVRAVCWALNGGARRRRRCTRTTPLLAEYLWTFNRPKIYR